EILVFFHDGKPPITESLIIVEYIDEIWGQSYPVLHEDPGDRAAARFWAKFIDETRRRKWWRSSSTSSWWSSLEQIMRDLTPPISNTKTAIRWKTKTEVLFVVLICFVIFSLDQFRSEISYCIDLHRPHRLQLWFRTASHHRQQRLHRRAHFDLIRSVPAGCRPSVPVVRRIHGDFTGQEFQRD
ncbi:Glutathione transferase GST 23, partial [Linum grandiflorum]